MTTAHIHEKRVGLYLRVSTSEQTTDNQRRELMAVAERHGWAVVQVFEDAGISGAKSRKDRPALDALLKAVARREIDMVAAWSVESKPDQENRISAKIRQTQNSGEPSQLCLKTMAISSHAQNGRSWPARAPIVGPFYDAHLNGFGYHARDLRSVFLGDAKAVAERAVGQAAVIVHVAEHGTRALAG